MDLIGWVIFIVALLFSVMLHESGHFVTAKKFGMKITRYFVGFGPTIWSTWRGETEYGIKALPFGGLVKIVGMTSLDEVDDPADEPRSFRSHPAWQRIIVLCAGSFMHFVLAFVLLLVLLLGIGIQNPGNAAQLGTIIPCVASNVTALDNGVCTASNPPSPARLAGVLLHAGHGGGAVVENNRQVAGGGRIVDRLHQARDAGVQERAVADDAHHAPRFLAWQHVPQAQADGDSSAHAHAGIERVERRQHAPRVAADVARHNAAQVAQRGKHGAVRTAGAQLGRLAWRQFGFRRDVALQEPAHAIDVQFAEPEHGGPGPA